MNNYPIDALITIFKNQYSPKVRYTEGLMSHKLYWSHMELYDFKVLNIKSEL